MLMPSNNLKPLVNDMEKLIADERVDIHNVDIDKNFLAFTFMFKRKAPDLRYKVMLGMISNMIDDISDGLTKELRIDNSLIYSMNADYMLNRANSYLALYTEISSKNIKPCLDISLDYINRVIKDGFSVEQFKKELEKDFYYWNTKVNNPNDLVQDLTRYRDYGKFVSDKDIHEVLQSVTLDEINATMRELFKDAKMHVFVYGNADKKDVYTIKQIQKRFHV